VERKARIDPFGAASLTGFALFLALNQIIIKVVNQGLQPVFFAGLRSALAVVCLTLWLVIRRRPPVLRRQDAAMGVLAGVLFAAEFVFLFVALDLTTVTHAAIMLYSMPIWMTVAAHFLLPGERMTGPRVAGLSLAFGGVVWVLLNRAPVPGAGGAVADLTGDLCALAAALCWASITLLARGTRFREMNPEMQLYWQVLVSAPILLVLAPWFGPLIRDLQPVHLFGLLYQAVLVVSAGFVFWLWLLSIYPASGVASFSFLTPVFGVALGWLLLREPVGPALIAALLMVAVGIVLINRVPRSGHQVPQKVRVTS
jgi:drug/metabolite transporter (DMT)-like permease